MRNLLASFLAVAGIGAHAQNASPTQQKVIDPKSVLFSISTLADDLPATVAVEFNEAVKRLLVGEDDWAQVEFHGKDRENELKRMLKELSDFESKNRVGLGWKNVYVRKLSRSNLVKGADAVEQIRRTLGVSRAASPAIAASGSIVGQVKDGYVLPLGGNISLYGVESASGISVLAASVGTKPDDAKLTQAFTKLNSEYSLILVDWRSKMLLLGTKSNGQILVWQP